MKKQNIQSSNYEQRERNFLSVVTSEDTFQVIVGHTGNNTLLLWQDEYYMDAYINQCETPITLSKVDTVAFLKWMKENHQDIQCVIHPVWGQETHVLHQNDLISKIIDTMESDGDFDDTLRESGLL